jgi:hypothetical protein
MKVLKAFGIFSIAVFPFISSYSQCSTCTITNPAVLPSPIPAGTTICITTNKTYDGSLNLTHVAFHICSGATLRINGEVTLDATSEITTTGCSRVEIDGNVHNANPTGLKVLDNCNCPNSIVPTGPIFGFGVICSPLPVELISFDAMLKNSNEVVLNWSTATEINNSYFVVERSKDVLNWEEVATVNGAGNSNQLKNYSTTDVLNEVGTFYYRLTQFDYDGKSETFDYRTVTCNSIQAAVEVNIFPNPAAEFVMLCLNGSVDVDMSMNILDLSGQVIYSTIIPKGSPREQRISLDSVKTGVYIIQISGGSISKSLKLIVGK